MQKIAFICVHNSCRSQIAEALGNKILAGRYECYSAGTEIKDSINEDAVRALNELYNICLLYTSPSPRDRTRSRMPSSA